MHNKNELDPVMEIYNTEYRIIDGPAYSLHIKLQEVKHFTGTMKNSSHLILTQRGKIINLTVTQARKLSELLNSLV